MKGNGKRMSPEDGPLYSPVRVLGHGAFGYVFEAIDKKTGEKVAIKRVRKAERKVSRECQILTMLKSKTKCVQMKDVFYTQDEQEKLTQNFVFEYVPDSLEDFIKSHRSQKKHMSIQTIKSLTQELLEGLAEVHELNICHRDLKPDNVLLTKELNVKLCDFGSSKKLDSTACIPHIVSRYYRAPELMLCFTKYTTKVDIWATGCIFLELFTLDPAFPGESEGLQLLEIMSLLGSPTTEDKKYLFQHLDKITYKMLEGLGVFQSLDLVDLFPKKYYRAGDIHLAAGLLCKMLQWNPNKRISAKEALKHPFFGGGGSL